VFSVEEREALRLRVWQLAEEDERVVAAAEVGSRAVGADDRWSDVDLTLGVDGATVEAVLEDWTQRLRDEFEAVPLVDLVLDRRRTASSCCRRSSSSTSPPRRPPTSAPRVRVFDCSSARRSTTRRRHGRRDPPTTSSGGE